MQVNLFANDRILNSYTRDLHHLSTKPVDIGVVFGQNVDRYKEPSPRDSYDVKFHKDLCLSFFPVREKTYDNVFGALYDMHHELAKLNILLGYNTYVTIISLEDSLDYVLHSLCGCSLESVRSIPNYTELSRSLLKVNFGELLNNFSVSDLLDRDPKLDSFLATVGIESRAESLDNSSEEEDPAELDQIFLKNLITKIITKVDDINKYLGYNYKRVREDAVTVKSKSACSFVLASKEKFEHEMVLKTADCIDYTLIVRSFERWEYAEKIDLPYSK